MEKYNCICCNYRTNRSDNFTKHNETTKHKTKYQRFINGFIDTTNKIVCDLCSDSFNSRSTYYRHYKNCKINYSNIEKNKIINDTLTIFMDKINLQLNEKFEEIKQIKEKSNKPTICNINIKQKPNDITEFSNAINMCFNELMPEKINISIGGNDNNCIIEECNKQACFKYENEKKPIYCYNHKFPNMIDIKQQKRCKTPLCDTRVSEKYEGYCLFCFINTFPDKPVSRNYKTKEKYVVDYVINQYPNISWISDKKIQDGCSRRRPDLLLDLGYQIIIIEIDENQHINYDCSCENKRLMELSQDVGHRPIVFIRFNPDDYDDVTSCWGIDKKGISIVKKTKVKEWNERLNSLKLQIDYWLENNTDKTLEVIQLFYDTK